MARILVADDHDTLRRGLALSLTTAGHEVEEAGNGNAAIERLHDGYFDVVVSDLKMGGSDGLDVLRTTRQLHPTTSVILMTAFGSVTTAVEAMKHGAFDYVQKPFELEEMEVKVEKALELKRLRNELDYLRNERQENYDFDRIVGSSESLQRVLAMVKKVAKSNSTVLIRGETGTGKELIAGATHHNSLRAARNFVKVNCAALQENLLESELFGHEKGAFTGADRQRIGRFEQADGGTLFLDEIGDMPTALQTRLLRVLAEGEFYRVGGQTPMRVDVRVIAATHQNLEDRVARGLFREDLFHRLNVIRMTLPPLRARREDVGDLLGHYLRIAATELGVEVKTIAPEARAALEAYAWPGNVRELVNLCRRLTVLAPGSEVRAEDLPAEIAAAAAGAAANPEHWSAMLARWAEGEAQRSGAPPLLDTAAPEFERALIRVALKHTGGHRQDAAKLLGWGRNTLTRKLKELGMEEAEAADEGVPSDAAA